MLVSVYWSNSPLSLKMVNLSHLTFIILKIPDWKIILFDKNLLCEYHLSGVNIVSSILAIRFNQMALLIRKASHDMESLS